MVREGDWTSRIRRLASRGRIAATVWERIALTEDGRDYYVVAGEGEPMHATDKARLAKLANFGDEGATIADFADAVGLKRAEASRVLEEFETNGWAEDDHGYPKRYVAAMGGLPL